MTQTEFLLAVVDRLNVVGIPYMITGSYACTIYGEPRTTNDVDIVVDPSVDQIRGFAEQFDENDYYVNTKTAVDAVNRHSMFNVIDSHAGWKADLIVKRNKPYSQRAFERRVATPMHGTDLFVIAPEDSVLSKLEWAEKGGSERQIKDIQGILFAQQSRLDYEYLKKWAIELQVEAQLQKLLEPFDTGS